MKMNRWSKFSTLQAEVDWGLWKENGAYDKKVAIFRINFYLESASSQQPPGHTDDGRFRLSRQTEQICSRSLVIQPRSLVFPRGKQVVSRSGSTGEENWTHISTEGGSSSTTAKISGFDFGGEVFDPFADEAREDLPFPAVDPVQPNGPNFEAEKMSQAKREAGEGQPGTSEEAAPQPVKRGRGRPRKNPERAEETQRQATQMGALNKKEEQSGVGSSEAAQVLFSADLQGDSWEGNNTPGFVPRSPEGPQCQNERMQELLVKCLIRRHLSAREGLLKAGRAKENLSLLVAECKQGPWRDLVSFHSSAMGHDRLGQYKDKPAAQPKKEAEAEGAEAAAATQEEESAEGEETE
ncbi:Hypp3237 [Branchiostoma lanceolatum]|uniref:Hypp3237 protein n=1 Tax=Branchiostoma lanceolatum TaxID=7740 RepID=A0A8K0ERA0_BRALA|nr:Hypp3237 [Branchiostoma lanceolatum]